MEIIKEKYTLREWQLTDVESLVKKYQQYTYMAKYDRSFPTSLHGKRC